MHWMEGGTHGRAEKGACVLVVGERTRRVVYICIWSRSAPRMCVLPALRDWCVPRGAKIILRLDHGRRRPTAGRGCKWTTRGWRKCNQQARQQLRMIYVHARDQRSSDVPAACVRRASDWWSPWTTFGNYSCFVLCNFSTTYLCLINLSSCVQCKTCSTCMHGLWSYGEKIKMEICISPPVADRVSKLNAATVQGMMMKWFQLPVSHGNVALFPFRSYVSGGWRKAAVAPTDRGIQRKASSSAASTSAAPACMRSAFHCPKVSGSLYCGITFLNK